MNEKIRLSHGKIKTLLFVFILLSLIFSLRQLDNAHAQKEVTLEEKASAFVTDVLGIDLPKYNAIVKTGPLTQPKPFNVSSPFIMKDVGYTLTSKTSTMTISLCFKNGLLNLCLIHCIQGSPIYIQQEPTNDFDCAKSFMQKYENYTSKYWTVDISYLQSANNLISISPENTTLSLTNGNTKFEVSSVHEHSFKWTYTQNNIDISQKRVEIDFRNGSLYSLYDGWNLYSVGTPNYFSEDQAISLALPAAKNFTLKFTQRDPIYGPSHTVIGHNETEIEVMPDLTNVTTQTKFSMEIRDTSSPTLYPLWAVDFTFSKPIYDVKGITVTVWGDTGEIGLILPDVVFGTSTIPTDTQPNPTVTPNDTTTLICLGAGIAVTVALAIAITSVILKKRSE